MSKYHSTQVELAAMATAGKEIKVDHHALSITLTQDVISSMLREYATHLRERESTMVVTYEMVEIAAKSIYNRMQPLRDIYGLHIHWEGLPESDKRPMRETARAALEAVAPHLASARVPDAMEVDDSLFQTWDHDTYKEYGYALGWNACRAATLAAAPKPETEE